MAANVAGTKDLLRRHALALARSASLDVEYETTVAAPIGETAELAGSIIAQEPSAAGDTIVTVIEARAAHAIFVVGGTQPHVISPTKAHGLLVFPSGGITVFVHGSVNHPGTAPNTAFWSDPVLQERWTRALQSATRSVVTT